MFLFPDVRGEIVRRVGRIIRLEIAFTWFSFLYNNLLASHGGSGKTLSNLISSKNCGASTKFHNIRTLWICDPLSLTKHGELSQVLEMFFSVKSLFTALFDKLASLGGGRTFETLPLKCQSSNNWVFGAGDGGRKRKDPRLGLAKHPGWVLKCSESVCAV